MYLLLCGSIDAGQCNDPEYVEVSADLVTYLNQYSGFVEDFYWIGFSSVLGLFITGLGVGLILKMVRFLK